MKAGWDSYIQKLQAYNEEVKKFNADMNSYAEKVKAYSSEVQRFNREISGKVYTIGTTEWLRIKEWERTLTDQKKALDSLRAQLEPMENTLKNQRSVLDSLRAQLELMWKPLGIVASIKIYW